MPKSVFTDANQIVIAVLRGARKRAGMRQTELASKIGKDQSYISNIERGQRRVDVLEFYAIATAMSLDPGELYGELAKRLPKKVEV